MRSKRAAALSALALAASLWAAAPGASAASCAATSAAQLAACLANPAADRITVSGVITGGWFFAHRPLTITGGTIRGSLWTNSNLTLENVRIEGQQYGVVVDNGYLIVRNSTFEGGMHPIFSWQVKGLNIAGSTFRNAASNAVVIDGPFTITDSVFDHNHRLSVYNLCGASGTEPCGGGQLYIKAGASGVVTRTLFDRGYVENCAGQACYFGVPGVEVDQYGVSRVTLTHNLYRTSKAGVLTNLQAGSGPVSKVLSAYSEFEQVETPHWQVGRAGVTVVQ